MTKKLDEKTLSKIDKGMSEEGSINRGSFAKYVKQEEIREALNTLCCVAKAKDLAKSPSGFDEDVDGAMLELDALGVVLKVEKELPEPCKWAAINNKLVLGASSVYKVAQQDMLKAGYVAVESLIKEK